MKRVMLAIFFIPMSTHFFIDTTEIQYYQQMQPFESVQIKSVQKKKRNKRKLQLNVGPIFNFARYNLGCLSKIQGYLAGIHFDFRSDRPSWLFTVIQFDGRWNAGFICDRFNTRSKIADYRPEMLLGYTFYCDQEKTQSFTPFLGLGFYHLKSRLKPNIITYKYFNLYVPVGFEARWDVRPGEFDIALRVFYRIDAWTRLKVFTPCVEQCECEKIRLKRSQGVHVELPCSWYHQKKRVTLLYKMVPFFDWNRFGRAKEGNCNGICFDIPCLDRWHLGLELNFGIQF